MMQLIFIALLQAIAGDPVGAPPADVAAPVTQQTTGAAPDSTPSPDAATAPDAAAAPDANAAPDQAAPAEGATEAENASATEEEAEEARPRQRCRRERIMGQRRPVRICD